MLRLVKGMVAETNDVWYWNHPNIDYWVSQQSLVYIKHSPVTGWPAGVILIIRRRNMAPALLGTDREGPWNTALKKKKEEEACCLLHLAPGLHLTCLVLMKVFCNFTRRKKTEIKNEVTELFNILKTSHSGLAYTNYFRAWMSNSHTAIQAYKSLDWYSMEWAEGWL